MALMMRACALGCVLTESELDDFHALTVDAHIRAYMFDGVEVECGWAGAAW